MLFHESTHGIVPAAISRSVRPPPTQKVTVPPQLSHAVLFYTAGELTTRELKARGIDYTAWANAAFYNSMCGAGCRDKMAEHWASASRRQALDRRRPLRPRRHVQVEAGLQTRLEVTALRSVVWTALFWLPAEAISVTRRTLRESAQRIDEPHLSDLRARHVEKLRTAHQDGKRPGARDGDVEPVAAEEKLQASRHVLSGR